MLSCPGCKTAMWNRRDVFNFDVAKLREDSRCVFFPCMYGESLMGQVAAHGDLTSNSNAGQYILPNVNLRHDVYADERVLLSAMYFGNDKNIEVLLGHMRATIVSRVKNPNGESPLHILASKNDVENLEAMHRRYHCAIDSVTANGDTPLHFACMWNAGYGSVEAAKYIIDNGGYTMETNCDGKTPLDLAEQSLAKCSDSDMHDDYEEMYDSDGEGGHNPFKIIIAMLKGFTSSE